MPSTPWPCLGCFVPREQGTRIWEGGKVGSRVEDQQETGQPPNGMKRENTVEEGNVYT